MAESIVSLQSGKEDADIGSVQNLSSSVTILDEMALEVVNYLLYMAEFAPGNHIIISCERG